MDLCLAAEQKSGLRLSRRWWEHPALDILGMRAGHAEAEVGGRQGRRNHRERVSMIRKVGGRDNEITRRTKDNQTEI